MKTRVSIGVVLLWLLVAFVWASQSVLGSQLQGTPIAMAAALRSSLVQTLPWIPVTLAIIALASRYPVLRATWRRTLPIHVLAFAALVYIENVLVVLAFWISSGQYGTIGALLSGGAYWAVMRVHVAALVYIAIAAITQGIAYYRDSRARQLSVARLEGQLARARLEALVARIRPHFLFNTLHTIGHLWRSGRHEDADAMLDHLGALFQRVQQSTAQTLVRLDEELDMVTAYLAIEQARFGDRLRITMQVDEEANACAVPPLLLQPIVENAIRHGVAQSAAAGRVVVSATVKDDRLTLEVEDDGPGLQDETDARGTGTGLTASRERLDQLFAGRYTLTLESGAMDGTRVRITIPAWPADTAAASAAAGLARTHA